MNETGPTTHRLNVYDADDDDDDVDVDGVQHDSECFGIVYTETDMIRNVVCVVCAHYSHRGAEEQYRTTWANSDTHTHTNQATNDARMAWRAHSKMW